MNSPTVSVIMPVRNGGSYLSTAVNSILDQDFDSLELILVDDHSTDSSISALNVADHRLTVLRNPGSGVSSAFNFGFEHARGSFIARMDADDISLRERITAQLNFLERHPEVDICGAKVMLFSDAGLAGGNRHYQDWLNRVCTPVEIERAMFIESPIPNPAAMFRAEALSRLGGYHDPEWPEDYDLFLRAHADGMKMAKPDPILLHWRDHDERLTRSSKRYSRGLFQAAKAHYLAQDKRLSKPVIIWGAGPSGAQIHDLLTHEGVEVQSFVEVHPRRIGGSKRGKPVFDISHVQGQCDATILVAVGSRGARPEIRSYLEQAGHTEGGNFLFIA